MCLPRGTVPAPSHLCRSGVLASPAPAPSQTLKDPRLTGAPPLWYLLRALRRGRAPQDSTEESVSDACGLLRPCRRSGTPQGIPAAEAVLRALTFSALGAPSGNRTTAAETLPGIPKIHCILVPVCYPALAILTVKSTVFVYTYRQIPFGKMPFCPAGMPAAPLSLPLTIVYNVTVRVTSERYQE